MNLQITNSPTLDPRPPDGEYIHPQDKFISFGWRDNSVCCVCGNAKDISKGYAVLAIVQNLAAGQRVISLFTGGGARLAGEFCTDNSAQAVITACQKHDRHLRYFIESLDDGIITADKINRLRYSIISTNKFEQLVQEEAHRLWSIKEQSRKNQDWDDAWSYLVAELGHIPGPAQRKLKAEELHLQRKDLYAEQDWLEALKNISKFFTTS